MVGVLLWGLQEARGHGPEARRASESWPRAGSLSRACQLMCGVSEEAWPGASGWKLVGRGLLGSGLALGPDSPCIPQTPTELESQTDRLAPANASVPSGEQLRRVLAEVERLLQEIRARDLGVPRAAAEAELREAQRCEGGPPNRAE